MDELATHVYCPRCKEIQEAYFEPLEKPSSCRQYLGGDVICYDCDTVVATLFKEDDE